MPIKYKIDKIEYKSVSYEPILSVKIPDSVIDLLIHLSTTHYDSYIESIGRFGGFLYGWKQRIIIAREINKTEDLEFDLDFKKLDSLCKLLEMRNALPDAISGIAINLYYEFKKLMNILQQKSREVNQPIIL